MKKLRWNIYFLRNSKHVLTRNGSAVKNGIWLIVKRSLVMGNQTNHAEAGIRVCCASPASSGCWVLLK